MTRRRLWASITVFGCVPLPGGWVVVLARNGLDRAGKWSSAVVTSVLSGPASWVGGAGDKSGPVQINQASGASTMDNVQGGDLNLGERAGGVR